MKRLASLISILLLFLLLMPDTCAAACQRYALPEVGISLEIPASFEVFTREGVSVGQMSTLDEARLKDMEENDIYLQARSLEGDGAEIHIVCTEDTLDDFSQMTASDMEALADMFAETYHEDGGELDESSVYLHTQTKFLKIADHRTEGNGGEYLLAYMTAHAKKWIAITLYSDTSFQQEQELMMEKLIDSVQLGLDTATTPAASDGAFSYRDIPSGVEFTVPGGWSEVPGERENEGAMFSIEGRPDMNIYYSYADAWDMIPEDVKTGKKNPDFAASYFTAEEIAREYGVPLEQTQETRLGGRDYVQINILADDPNDIFDVDFPMTILVRCENAKLYIFIFSDSENSFYYQDFIDLVSSVKYPELPAGEPAESGDGVRTILAGAGIALLCVGLLAAAAVWKRGRKGKTVDGGEPEPAGRPKYCRFCGEKLPESGEFCEQCGWKIES